VNAEVLPVDKQIGERRVGIGSLDDHSVVLVVSSPIIVVRRRRLHWRALVP
jgi:hypothetical protein